MAIGGDVSPIIRGGRGGDRHGAAGIFLWTPPLLETIVEEKNRRVRSWAKRPAM
jgi:hypothetical protein